MGIFNFKTLIFLLIISIQTAYSQADKTIPLISNPAETFAPKISLIDSIINFSKTYIGSPYRGGGKGPNSFDCSGFTSFVFSNFGIKLGSSSGGQAEQTPTIAKNDILPGDLVFYNGYRRGSRVGHVGLVVSKHEDGTFDFIHSASSVGISISHSESDYYNRRYIKAGRVITFDSLIARANSIPNPDYKPMIVSNIQPVTMEQTENATSIKKTVPATYHYVKSGETLTSIAAKYGLTVAQLKKKNDLRKDMLQPKQRLLIKDKKEIEIAATTAKAIKNSESRQKTDSMKVVEHEVINDNAVTSEFYIVQKGETLYSLSKKFNLSTNELKTLNNLSSATILAGQKLIVTKSTNLSVHEKAKSSKIKTHTVKSGETLSEIAVKYNCTVRELKAWNSKSNNKLSLGEKLKIKI